MTMKCSVADATGALRNAVRRCQRSAGWLGAAGLIFFSTGLYAEPLPQDGSFVENWPNICQKLADEATERRPTALYIEQQYPTQQVYDCIDQHVRADAMLGKLFSDDLAVANAAAGNDKMREYFSSKVMSYSFVCTSDEVIRAADRYAAAKGLPMAETAK
ncbi:hypothetical protein [Thiosocius teredinicola]|uniref:hypothetical protein n=1 Tax=Thiosocius teredinicola TaxID=1973002 RepID=UPI0009911C7B